MATGAVATAFRNLLEPRALVDHFLAHPPKVSPRCKRARARPRSSHRSIC